MYTAQGILMYSSCSSLLSTRKIMDSLLGPTPKIFISALKHHCGRHGEPTTIHRTASQCAVCDRQTIVILSQKTHYFVSGLYFQGDYWYI